MASKTAIEPKRKKAMERAETTVKQVRAGARLLAVRYAKGNSRKIYVGSGTRKRLSQHDWEPTDEGYLLTLATPTLDIKQFADEDLKALVDLGWSVILDDQGYQRIVRRNPMANHKVYSERPSYAAPPNEDAMLLTPYEALLMEFVLFGSLGYQHLATGNDISMMSAVEFGKFLAEWKKVPAEKRTAWHVYLKG